METASDLNALNRDFSTMAGDVELYRFYAAIGDHAQVVCDGIREVDENSPLKQSWTILLPKLDNEERLLTAWKASGENPSRPKTPYKDAFEARVEALVADGWTGLDTDIALFAARTYANRNSSFHGRSYDLFKPKKYADLARYLEMDDKRLEGLLPGEEKKLAGKYRKIIELSRSSRISMDDNGNWGKRQAPPPEVPYRFMPPSKATLRSSMEMGVFRPAGLNGPPPPNSVVFQFQHWEPSSRSTLCQWRTQCVDSFSCHGNYEISYMRCVSAECLSLAYFASTAWFIARWYSS